MSCDQVDGLHQKVVIEVLVEVEEKVQTHFAEGKGKNHSCNMKNDVFVMILLFIFNFHVIEE